MKKVLIVGPNIGLGGVERASCNLANALSSAKIKVHYLSIIPEAKFYSLCSEVGYDEPNGFNVEKLSLLRTLLYIRKKVYVFKPDVIIAFTKFYAALANMALWLSPYNVIVTERSSPLYKWPIHIELFSQLSFMIKRPSKVIAQTSQAAYFQKKYYNKRVDIEVIPNALRKIEKYPAIKREKWILAVGRFHDECKGFDQLVKAFNLIDNEDWRLVFAGGTHEEGHYLVDLVKNHTTANRIDFLGKVKDIDKIYAKAGVFVIPSRREGFPNVLCEAMAAGCPCISFDFIAGPRDLISQGRNGIIVPDGDIQALAETIDSLIDSPEQRATLGEAARAITDRLDPDKIAQMHLEFLFSDFHMKQDFSD